ncbi:Receptor-type tyrosine-protein phosphatase R [Bagarius yarrelli]|uniref:protein-tyrosine-phosphatase n=1 Tax=Bagarius yarrelli TaxID=175774 RepID=A0A556V8F2_BAGYA|nr:Receptor-type tyrosine-protein phosphatase R [Bagarius yarrelli]
MPGPSCLSLLSVLLLVTQIAEGFSGDDEGYRSRRYGRLVSASLSYRHSGADIQNREQSPKYKSHARPLFLTARRIPSTLPKSRFRQVPQDHSELSLLAKPDDETHMENTPISAKHIVTMIDVRQLNVSLLQTFREGVAAALDISPRHVHINRLNEQKNGIELYVSSERAGASEPVSSEEVIRSLNINILHSSLGPFGITEVFTEGYLRREKSYIATQGPMINTVNDFWQMAWQEDSPVIVMITKLKEKYEECVLYWPEKRGIYGKVVVLVNGVRDCEHYTVRTLTLKVAKVVSPIITGTHHGRIIKPQIVQGLCCAHTDVEKAESRRVRGPVIVHCR